MKAVFPRLGLALSRLALALMLLPPCSLAAAEAAPPGAPPGAPEDADAPAPETEPDAQPEIPDAPPAVPPTPSPERAAALERILQEAMTNNLPNRSFTNRLPARTPTSPVPQRATTPAGPGLAPPAIPAPTPRPTPGLPALPAPGRPAFAAPPAPGAPTPIPSGALPATVPAMSGAEDLGLDPLLDLNNAPYAQVFDEYSRYSGKVILHPNNMQGGITLKIGSEVRLSNEEILQALEGVLALNGVSLIPLGEKFVKAVLSQTAMAEGSHLNTRSAKELPDSEEFITHIAQLKYALPSELGQLLASFSKTPQSIVPIDSSQILVIRDYASNVKRMLQLIEKIDVEPETEYKLEVIPIKYGTVTDLYTTMSSLIGGSGGAVGTLSSQRRTTGGLTPTSGFGGSSRFGSSRSGLGGSRSGLGNTGLNNRLNQPYANQQQFGNVPGQNIAGQPVGTTTGQSFRDRLNAVINRQGTEGSSEVLGDARIVPDERANSLIVYANKHDMQVITNIVSKVDVLLAQVLIEGIVVAVSLGDQTSVGVSWAQNPKQFGADFLGGGAANNLSGFFGTFTNFPSATPGGFSYFGRLGDQIQVALQALASDSRVRVLQRPRIQTSHAVPGSFFSGSTVPYVTGFSDYGYVGSISSRSQVEQIQVGVSLQVTPYITPDGLVVLDIYQDISQLGEYVKIDNNDVPTTTSRSAQATLSIRDGETIMLGGYIEDNRSTGKSGVPLLMKIPILGNLFRSKTEKNSRSELILLMKVTVLKNPTDASILAESERTKLPGIADAQKEFQKTEDDGQRKLEKETRKSKH